MRGLLIAGVRSTRRSCDLVRGRHRVASRGRIGNAFRGSLPMPGGALIRTFAAWAFGWLEDRLSDIADEAWDAATTVAEAAWDAATEVADTAVDAVGYAAAHTGDVIGTVGTVVDTATFGVASAVLDVVDNTVLDAVDELTGGLIDIDFDDGNLSASVGVDGVLHVGAAVGDDGIRHSSDVLDQSYDVSADEDGLDAEGQAGIDWGPLPYAEGDLTVEADGDIAARRPRTGHVADADRRSSPGEAEAEIVRDGDMWGAEPRRRRNAVLPSGDVVKWRRRCGLRRHARRIGAQRRRRGLVHASRASARSAGRSATTGSRRRTVVDRALRGRRLRRGLRRAGRRRRRRHQRHDTDQLGQRRGTSAATCRRPASPSADASTPALQTPRRLPPRSPADRGRVRPRSPPQTTSRRASTTCSASLG